MIDKKRMIVILGPTACGKTSFACHLASRIDGEIISGDSRQVYRRMDIGTGKDLSDYCVDNKPIPYHLIDIREAGEKYNLYDFQHDCFEAYQDIVSRNRTPLLCGGTGLYLESVIKGYQLSPVPQNHVLRKQLEGKTLGELTAILKDLKEQNHSAMHNKTDIDTPQRAIRAIEIEHHNLHHPMPERVLPALPHIIIGLDIEREERRKRISQRLRQRFSEGMVDEVKQLINSGIPPEDLIYYGLEYKYITEYVIGQRSYDDMVQHLEIAIHQFAKRQMTWFRGMERRGFTIHWIDAMDSMATKLERAKQILEEN